MSAFVFGTRSTEELATCDDALVGVMRKALEFTNVDFGIVQGARTIEQQRSYFKAGNSKVNPDAYIGNLPALYKAAKHITGPGMPKSRACDIIVSGGKTYDAPTLCHIAGVVLTCAKNMGIPVRWGGNWDGDSIIITDQTLNDLVHFELA
jgi:peptidoglycan L-alanyl-D-glutamate endopeptidase CwlK